MSSVSTSSRVSEHAIETLRWNCCFDDHDLANAMQSRISQFLRGPALEAMNTLFERISPPDEVWQIDTLEIDLGLLDPRASPEQWTERLIQAVWDSLLRQRQQINHPALPLQRASAKSVDQHDLDNFLFYLEQGRLPWAMNPLTGPRLADWLARLARRTGPRLWGMLQDLRPGEYVLARLSLIAPYQGLQALLMIRHADLAQGLDFLDQQILAPWLARGRISAYQMQKIQQMWRVAGLTSLWREQGSQLSASRVQQLIRILTDALEAVLGRRWMTWGGSPLLPDTDNTAELSRILLAGVVGEPALSKAWVWATDVADTASSQQVLDRALLRLDMVLSARQSVSPDEFFMLLDALAERSPAALHIRLQHHVKSRANRRVWLTTLGPRALWQLMQRLVSTMPTALAGEGSPVEEIAAHPVLADTWEESLRQFSLAAIRSQGGLGIGMSALQLWLADYTLRYLMLGKPMPQDHVAWQALWRQAMSELLGEPFHTERGDHKAESTSEGLFMAMQNRDRSASFAPQVEVENSIFALPALLQSWKRAQRSHHASLVAPRSAGPDLLVAYRQAMTEEAEHSRQLPPSLYELRWQRDLLQQIHRAALPLAANDLASKRRGWRGVAGQSVPADPLPAVMSPRLGIVISASPAGLPEGGLSGLLTAWAQGNCCTAADARWLACWQMPPEQLRGALLPWVHSPAWRSRVVSHWPVQRKLELLVLLTLAGCHPQTVGRAKWSWQLALERWRWLPATLAGYANVSKNRATHGGAASPIAPIVWRAKALADWLWAEAIVWAARLEDRPVEEAALIRHWHGAARDLLAEPASGQTASCDEVSWQALAPRLLVALSGQVPPSDRHAVADESVNLSHTKAESESAWSLKTLDTLLEKTQQWGGRERLWVSTHLADPAHSEACLAHCSITERWILLSAQFPSGFAALKQQSDRLQVVWRGFFPQMSLAEVEELHWRFLFSHCFLAGLPLAPGDLTRRFALHLAQIDLDRHGRNSVSLHRWQTRLAEALGTMKLSTSVRDGQSADVTDGVHPELESLRRAPSRAEQWEASLPAVRRPASLPVPAAKPASVPAQHEAVLPEQTEPIFLANAGLVLLAAYTQRLFSMLGLLQEGRFIDEAAQARAVHCLAFMTDGHCDGDETLWVLNKLLCGVPLNRPIAPCEGLDVATQETLNGLLQAVITHWKILGSTSIAGLRETFLNRQGRLVCEPGVEGRHWRLKVAPGPFDMLLDHLPWSYAMIKSPWMEEMLYVDWR